MKIIVFGATGKTGSLVVNQLLQKGHQVTAYVRNAQKLTISDPNLTVIENSLEDANALKGALQDQAIVVSCLGSSTMKPSHTLEDFAIQISSAMKSVGVHRIIYMATAGIHNEIKGIPGFIVKMILGNVIKDHAAAANTYIQSDAIYTIVRPVSLSDGPLTNTYKKATQGLPGSKAISRADVASFIVDTVETNQFTNASIGLSS